jgi:Lrp/AsnC family transcriptional regulator
MELSSHDRPRSRHPLHEPNRRLDAIDRKILTVLQEDASLSVAEIGDRVGLSSTPCWKRIQRLEADGVILRRVALVDQNKIGLGISVFVSVESADHSEGLAAQIRRCRSAPCPR